VGHDKCCSGGLLGLYQLTRLQSVASFAAVAEAICASQPSACTILGAVGSPSMTVAPGMQVKRDGVSKLVILPLYPQFSISTSGSSLRLLEAVFKSDPALRGLPHTVIPSWYQRRGYIVAQADLIEVCAEICAYRVCTSLRLDLIARSWRHARVSALAYR